MCRRNPQRTRDKAYMRRKRPPSKPEIEGARLTKVAIERVHRLGIDDDRRAERGNERRPVDKDKIIDR